MRKTMVLFFVGGLALPTCALSEDNPDHACATIAMHVISGLKDEDENIPELLRLCNNLADQKNCRAAVDMIAEAKKRSPLKCKSGYTAPSR